MARGISFHVGLNAVDPDHYDGWDGALTACEFDANDMESLALSRGFETTKLLTPNATAEAVTKAIEGAASELEPGDVFFISYSGHGGQVPDTNGEGESDSSDETWLAYDRQIVDDELYELWAKFKPGVRIIVLSDSCHSGSVNRTINDRTSVPDPVKTAEEAAKHDPRFRALPRDKMIATYEQNENLYDAIQDRVASSTSSEPKVGARVLLISGLPGRPALARRLQERGIHRKAARGLGRRRVDGQLFGVPRGHPEPNARRPATELQPGRDVQPRLRAARPLHRVAPGRRSVPCRGKRCAM